MSSSTTAARRHNTIRLAPEPSVDFIENRLPAVDPAFHSLPQVVHYDADAVPPAFVPVRGSPAATHRIQQPQPEPRQLPVRKLPPGTAAMRFWDPIFPQSMHRHKCCNPTEPPRLAKKPIYSIRDQARWDDVYARLQSARVEFDSSKSAFWGRYKQGYRRVAGWSDKAAATPARLIPDSMLVSPVKAALEVSLDVIRFMLPPLLAHLVG